MELRLQLKRFRLERGSNSDRKFSRPALYPLSYRGMRVFVCVWGGGGGGGGGGGIREADPHTPACQSFLQPHNEKLIAFKPRYKKCYQVLR